MGEALGMIETRGMIALIEASDAMVKAANVTMVGWQKIGSGYVTAMVRGDVAAGRAAETVVALAGGRDDETGGLLAVEGAQALVDRAGGLEVDVLTHHLDDVGLILDAGDDVGIVEVGRRFDDGFGPASWIVTLENAAAHENAVDAQLHHQRGVGGRGDAAGREVARQAGQDAGADGCNRC